MSENQNLTKEELTKIIDGTRDKLVEALEKKSKVVDNFKDPSIILEKKVWYKDREYLISILGVDGICQKEHIVWCEDVLDFSIRESKVITLSNTSLIDIVRSMVYSCHYELNKRKSIEKEIEDFRRFGGALD